MSDYTPTTEAIRGRIIQRGIGWGFYGLDEFDRWLAAHDAAKRREWEAEQGDYYEGFEEGVKVGRDGLGPRPITDAQIEAVADSIESFFEEHVHMARRLYPDVWKRDLAHSVLKAAFTAGQEDKP